MRVRGPGANVRDIAKHRSDCRKGEVKLPPLCLALTTTGIKEQAGLYIFCLKRDCSAREVNLPPPQKTSKTKEGTGCVDVEDHNKIIIPSTLALDLSTEKSIKKKTNLGLLNLTNFTTNRYTF